VREGADTPRSSTWVIFSEELRVHLRSRWYVIFTAIVVVVLVVAMILVPAIQGGGGTSAGGTAAEQDFQWIGFMDESGLFSDLEGSGGPIEYESAEAGMSAVAVGDIKAFYVIPEDYLQSGKVEQYAEFEGRFPTNPEGEATFRALLVHGLVDGKLDESSTTRILTPAVYENFRVEQDGTLGELTPQAEEVAGMLVPMLFAILLGTSIAVGFSYMMQSVAEEKESRLVEVVVTSASPMSIMGGKLLALLTMGLVQAAVWAGAAAITVPVMLSGLTGGSEYSISAALWLTIIMCFIAGYLLTANLAIFVAAIAPSAREAGRLGGWVPVFSFAPFWFTALFMAQPDGLAADLLTYIPLFAPTGILLRTAAGSDIGAWQIAMALVGTVAVSLVVLWVSSRVFRAAILMKGQRFTRRNVWAALRDSD